VKNELEQVCQELRQYIIDVVSVNGGHFGSQPGCGGVNSCPAIRILNTPYDQLVWDVGHQAYGHKILTGRREVFDTNRLSTAASAVSPNGLKAIYDTFGVGHSSTSISAALGMAVASQYKGETDRQHVAVIGDGSMTCGYGF
jgi:1-deoxy-D-xylulose-5-phosphate synthase